MTTARRRQEKGTDLFNSLPTIKKRQKDADRARNGHQWLALPHQQAYGSRTKAVRLIKTGVVYLGEKDQEFFGNRHSVMRLLPTWLCSFVMILYGHFPYWPLTYDKYPVSSAPGHGFADSSIVSRGYSVITQLKYKEGLQRESDLLDAVTNLSRARYNEVAVIGTVFENAFRITRMAEGFKYRSSSSWSVFQYD